MSVKFRKENSILAKNELFKNEIDGYLILTTDPHFSEYISSYYKDERLFFSPFSGSAGEVLITKDKTYLFVDGRYWVQAEEELKGSDIVLIKVGDKDVLPLEKFIVSLNIKKLGIDFSVLSYKMNEKFKKEGIELVDTSFRYLVKNITSLPKNKVFKLDDSLNTLSYKEKLDYIINKLKENKVDMTIISSLDDIAYLLNIRGNDILNNPVFYSYLYIDTNKRVILFIDKDKIDFELDGVQIKEYDEFFDFILDNKINSKKVLLDPLRTSLKVIINFKDILFKENPSLLFKAIKLEKEIENTKKIQAIDGLALLKFSKYLEDNIDNNLNEFDYSEKLKEFRLSSPLCFDLSFESIVSVGSNAAQMHYAPTKEKHSVVSKKDIELLVDSGGQYYGGTTDTTRTFLIGNPTKEYIHDYTLTLKAVINLSSTIFLKGCTGQSIDIKARELMWQEGMDYKCGTGHGVGYILNVHESPNGFRYRRVVDRDDGAEIVPGMITTIEPGVYKTNKYGIRIENNLLCVKAFETPDGEFFKFETITYVPIELRAVDFTLLTQKEIDWINDYHALVYSKLRPLIKNDSELVSYLIKLTKRI